MTAKLLDSPQYSVGPRPRNSLIINPIYTASHRLSVNPRRSQWLTCSATEKDQQQQQQQQQQEPSLAPKVNAVPDPEIQRGQRTAIITGAVSIVFGIAYLALVQFMDMRGGELLPPPPEAYLP